MYVAYRQMAIVHCPPNHSHSNPMTSLVSLVDSPFIDRASYYLAYKARWSSLFTRQKAINAHIRRFENAKFKGWEQQQVARWIMMTGAKDSPDSLCGRKTIIAGYCERRLQKKGHENCVFLCLKRGRKHYAIDIPIERDKPNLGLDRLRRESGPWWKRWSLYSAIGVQEVNVIALQSKSYLM